MAVIQQPPTSTSPQDEKMARLQRGYLPYASAIQLVLAALAIYAGQYLMVQIPKSREWGLAILIAGILLAYFRLKSTQVRGWLDWLQVGLGFLICFPITLNVDNWTVEIHPSILIILWLLSILMVATPALKLSPRKFGSAWPDSGHFTRSDWILLGILLLRAFIFRITALESIPAPIDPDEASLGLAPLLVTEIFGIIRTIAAEERNSVLMVEQNAMAALSVANRGFVMENGKVVLDGSSQELLKNEDVQEFYLGLSQLGEKTSYREVKHYRRRKRWLG